VTTLSDLAKLVRAPAALSVPGDVLAGAAVAGTLGGCGDRRGWDGWGERGGWGARACGLCAASVCLYWAGMAANDWADREVDAAERPGRPIPSGRVPAGTALGVAAGLTAAGLALAGQAGGWRALAVAAPLAGAMWAYDLGLKRTAAGPAAMAACRGLDVLLGASSGPWRRAALPAGTVAAHTYLVTALSRREVTGSDPLLPAATLAGTLAVAAATAIPGPVVPRPAVLVPAVPGSPAAHRGWRRRLAAGLATGLAAAYAASYGRPQTHAVAEPTAANLQAAVAAGITSLPALQGALIARSGDPLAGAAVAVAAPLGRRLARWWSPT
jgi:4-hydroxybenzoate polyprenyltransferase